MRKALVVANIGIVMVLALTTMAQALTGYDYSMAIDIRNTTGTDITARIVVPINASNLINGNYMKSDAQDVRLVGNGGQHDFAAANLTSIAAQWTIESITLPANSVTRKTFWTNNPAASRDQPWCGSSADTVTVPDDASLDITDKLTIQSDINIASFPGGTAYDVIARKPQAYQLTVNGSDTLAGSVYHFQDIPQLSTDADHSLYSTADTRVGQYISSHPAGNITQVKFHIRKVGTPAGTAYCRIRRYSDDSIIGTVGSVNVATLGAAYGWETFNTDVEVANEGLRIVLEYTGGNVTDYIQMATKDTDVTSYGVRYRYDGAHSTHSGKDVTFRVQYYTTTTVQATISADTDYAARMTYDGANLRLYVDGAEEDSTAATGAIDTNGNDLSILDLDGTVDDLRIGDTSIATPTWRLNLPFEPGQLDGATIEDQSASSNDASYTLGANPAGITVTVHELRVAAPAEASYDSEDMAAGLITGTPPQPANFYGDTTTEDWGDVPGSDLLSSLATASGDDSATRVPLGFVWLILIGAGLVLAGYLTYRFSKNSFVVGIVVLMCLAFCAITLPAFGWWIIALYLIFALTVTVMEKQVGF